MTFEYFHLSLLHFIWKFITNNMDEHSSANILPMLGEPQPGTSNEENECEDIENVMMSLDSLILQDLECPVCTEYIFPPIRQCTNGHSVCYPCFNKLPECPYCRAPKGVARSHTLELLYDKIYFPCKNRHVGCKVKSRGMTIKDHEVYCEYISKLCPFRFVSHCNWSGSMTDFIDHSNNIHGNYTFATNFTQLRYINFKRLRVERSFFNVFYTYNELFLCAWKLYQNTGLMKWCTYYLGRQDMANQFSFEITLENLTMDHNVLDDICIRAPCKPYDNSTKIFKSSSCIMLHYDTLKNYCNWRGDLLYKVKIIDNRLLGLMQVKI